MAEKDQVVEEKLEHTGIFDFPGFYAFAHAWLKDKDYGVLEDKYSEKVSGNAKDIEAEWKISKKLSDYFKIEAKFEIKATGLVDVEAAIDGEKKKMNKGKLSIKIKGMIVKDPESKWETSPTLRFMRDVYNKFIIPARVSAIEDRIRGDFMGLKEELKAYLDLSGRRSRALS